MLRVDEVFEDNPFQLHIVSEEEWKKRYEKFVEKDFLEV